MMNYEDLGVDMISKETLQRISDEFTLGSDLKKWELSNTDFLKETGKGLLAAARKGEYSYKFHLDFDSESDRELFIKYYEGLGLSVKLTPIQSQTQDSYSTEEAILSWDL